jgi:hypothetical protein
VTLRRRLRHQGDEEEMRDDDGCRGDWCDDDGCRGDWCDDSTSDDKISGDHISDGSVMATSAVITSDRHRSVDNAAHAHISVSDECGNDDRISDDRITMWIGRHYQRPLHSMPSALSATPVISDAGDGSLRC